MTLPVEQYDEVSTLLRTNEYSWGPGSSPDLDPRPRPLLHALSSIRLNLSMHEFTPHPVPHPPPLSITYRVYSEYSGI